VYLKRRIRADLRGADASELAPSLPLRGSPVPESLYVRQGPVGFWVSLGQGLATGLFLDQRANWGRVFDAAAGASLLNLFSYTGAFTLAAAAGGAASSVSVDLAGRALSRLRENLELNGLSGPQHRLFKDDVLSWLARARRAQRRFDWIVLDPPSFGTRSRGVLSTERDYAGLVAGALALLEPRGRLLCVSHHRKISLTELAERVEGACKSGGYRGKVEALVGAWDCPTLPGVSDTQSVLARLQ
jgi:23S rRNA (cytosine1962-C5)-methyltransferase